MPVSTVKEQPVITIFEGLVNVGEGGNLEKRIGEIILRNGEKKNTQFKVVDSQLDKTTGLLFSSTEK